MWAKVNGPVLVRLEDLVAIKNVYLLDYTYLCKDDPRNTTGESMTLYHVKPDRLLTMELVADEQMNAWMVAGRMEK